jgi:crotonobetainyl-CoA:carnitine CoA-transferase CaiB-like acyl-CoA transferase
MDPVPALGAHTVDVLTELGRTPAEIAELADRRVI